MEIGFQYKGVGIQSKGIVWVTEHIDEQSDFERTMVVHNITPIGDDLSPKDYNALLLCFFEEVFKARPHEGITQTKPVTGLF